MENQYVTSTLLDVMRQAQRALHFSCPAPDLMAQHQKAEEDLSAAIEHLEQSARQSL